MTGFDTGTIRALRECTILRDPQTGELSTYRVQGLLSAQEGAANSPGETRWNASTVPTHVVTPFPETVEDEFEPANLPAIPDSLTDSQPSPVAITQPTPKPGRHRLDKFNLRITKPIGFSLSLGSIALGLGILYSQRGHFSEVWDHIADALDNLS